MITYDASQLQAYAPVASQHVATGVTVVALIAAATTQSDNTAANLLEAQLGGPSGLQAQLRRVGDPTTDVDRYEPALSTAAPGDRRDTSTPRALATDLRRFVLGGLLTSSRAHELAALLVANTTGDPFIRAGVPASWRVGDKTGNGDWGTRNDIAVVWPPDHAPIVIALLSHRGAQDSSSADALLADATRVVVAGLVPTPSSATTSSTAHPK